ncbi:MAG: bifunctional phosphopantothenoylcysteine decarboxylase/phosphopantothenate--cysteine ligase CoaBC [Saprospiraceae bacterium]|nr:bifunctional phosphopantothenoylcysteine decarboxylase/phosphopantothenate--cysteine ligase CoaBC [Saprospiraceae bacterium]
MGKLSGKKILIGITGSISAYKSVVLVRLLQKEGAIVKVVMTESSKEFVGELTFSTLCNSPVYSNLSQDNQWSNHVELGLWAELFLIAPASANTLAKMTHGLVDNLLTAIYLSAKCPIMVAPAMDLDMWNHKITQSNLQILQQIGIQIIPVGDGHLASGLSGPGRLAEPEEIVEIVKDFFIDSNLLSQKNILITAGPTYEAIDPVRFIGNRSSGKMGIRLAEEAAKLGAHVDLILGPSNESILSHSLLNVIRVESAQQMLDEVTKLQSKIDCFIFAAAVADYKVESPSQEKIKKTEINLDLHLTKNPDIALTIGKSKRSDQISVGFALETENLFENAKSKLDKKNMDFIVMNTPKVKNSAFGFDTNQISIYHKDGRILEFELKTKKEVAKDILHEIYQLQCR